MSRAAVTCWCAAQEAANERLWFKTNLKLSGLWFQLKEFGRAQRILKDLHKCALSPSAPKPWGATSDLHPSRACSYMWAQVLRHRLARACEGRHSRSSARSTSGLVV